MSDPEVLIIGAGAAGIAAARALRAAGRSCLVLEARTRPGGRAATDSTTLGAPFDLGATWLHAADRNPLRPLAEALGIRIEDDGAPFDGTDFSIALPGTTPDLLVGPRIGISKAQDLPWRFGLAGATGLSRPFPG